MCVWMCVCVCVRVCVCVCVCVCVMYTCVSVHHALICSPPLVLRGVPYITWEDSSKMRKEAEVRRASYHSVFVRP